MSTAQHYRHNAIHCLCMAAEANDPKAKALLLFMAGAWNNLADRANRNRVTSRESAGADTGAAAGC
jgi:hypothetical protein